MVSTDVAAMGLDVRDLNLSINIGTLVMDSHPGLYNIISRRSQEWVETKTAGGKGREERIPSFGYCTCVSSERYLLNLLSSFLIYELYLKGAQHQNPRLRML